MYFSKAFDVVDHAIIISELKLLEMPAIKNWIISLTGQSQITKVVGCFPGVLEIRRCIARRL
jgi:hypothetical protein